MLYVPYTCGKPVKKLRSVFSAHPEAVLLVTRTDTGIKSVGDLKGKIVNIGNPGSGQRGNSMDLLPLYGIDPSKDIKAEGLQQGEASISRRLGSDLENGTVALDHQAPSRGHREL